MNVHADRALEALGSPRLLTADRHGGTARPWSAAERPHLGIPAMGSWPMDRWPPPRPHEPVPGSGRVEQLAGPWPSGW